MKVILGKTCCDFSTLKISKTFKANKCLHRRPQNNRHKWKSATGCYNTIFSLSARQLCIPQWFVLLFSAFRVLRAQNASNRFFQRWFKLLIPCTHFLREPSWSVIHRMISQKLKHSRKTHDGTYLYQHVTKVIEVNFCTGEEGLISPLSHEK
jgi:hypothetical protein